MGNENQNLTNPNDLVDVRLLDYFKQKADAAFAPSSAALYPVDVNTLTPSSTFRKNSIIGINGVIYRAKVATSHFPVVLQVSGNAFVVNTINGKIAFVVTNATVDSDWEQWTDAAIEYWLNQLAARTTALENADASLSARMDGIDTAMAQRPASITYGGVTYSVTDLLTAVAQLMTKKIVTGG